MVEVNELPVDTALVTVEMPNEVVCPVPTVDEVPVVLADKLTDDVRGVVPTI